MALDHVEHCGPAAPLPDLLGEIAESTGDIAESTGEARRRERQRSPFSSAARRVLHVLALHVRGGAALEVDASTEVVVVESLAEIAAARSHTVAAALRCTPCFARSVRAAAASLLLGPVTASAQACAAAVTVLLEHPFFFASSDCARVFSAAATATPVGDFMGELLRVGAYRDQVLDRLGEACSPCASPAEAPAVVVIALVRLLQLMPVPTLGEAVRHETAVLMRAVAFMSESNAECAAAVLAALVAAGHAPVVCRATRLHFAALEATTHCALPLCAPGLMAQQHGAPDGSQADAGLAPVQPQLAATAAPAIPAAPAATAAPSQPAMLPQWQCDGLLLCSCTSRPASAPDVLSIINASTVLAWRLASGSAPGGYLPTSTTRGITAALLQHASRCLDSAAGRALEGAPLAEAECGAVSEHPAVQQALQCLGAALRLHDAWRVQRQPCTLSLASSSGTTCACDLGGAVASETEAAAAAGQCGMCHAIVRFCTLHSPLIASTLLRDQDSGFTAGCLWPLPRRPVHDLLARCLPASARVALFRRVLTRMDQAALSRHAPTAHFAEARIALSVRVRRGHELEDAHAQLGGACCSSLDAMAGRMLLVAYEGEAGSGPGVAREFLCNALAQARGAVPSLFDPAPDAQQEVAPASPRAAQGVSTARLLGRLLGFALHDGQPGGHALRGVAFAAALGHTFSLRELAREDSVYARSLAWLLTHPLPSDMAAATDAEEPALAFVAATRQGREVELVRGGQQTAVGEHNKHEYVQLAARARLVGGMEQELLELARGMLDVVPIFALGWLTVEDLVQRLCGSPPCPTVLRQRSVLEGYTADHPQVAWFWDAVLSMSDEQRCRLLQFATGSPLLQLGASSDEPSLRLSRATGGDAHLPAACTCARRLMLPEYSSPDVLRRHLQFVTRDDVAATCGFGYM